MQVYLSNTMPLEAGMERWVSERMHQPPKTPPTTPWLTKRRRKRYFLFSDYQHISLVCRERANLLPGKTLRRHIW